MQLLLFLLTIYTLQCVIVIECSYAYQISSPTGEELPPVGELHISMCISL